MAGPLEILDAIEKIHGAITLIIDIYEGVQNNKELCSRLIMRLRGIDEILSQKNHQNALKEGKSSTPLKILLQICCDAQKYVEKFKGKNIIGQIFSFQSAKDNFVELDARISQAVGDISLLCASRLESALLASTPRDEVQDMFMSKSAGAMQMMRDDKKLQMITWVDPHPENNDNFIKKITSDTKLLAIVQRTCYDELYTDLMANRDIAMDPSALWRWRIICNTTHPKEKDGEGAEDAHKYLIQQLMLDSIQVPVMIYTGKRKVATVDEALRNEDSLSVHPNAGVTSLESCINKYCHCCTLLWIGESEGNEIEEAIREIQNNGVMVARYIESRDEDYDDPISWAEEVLEENRDNILKGEDGSIRILVNIDTQEDEDTIEAKTNLVNDLREEWAWTNPVLFYCDDSSFLEPHVEEVVKLADVTTTDKLADVIKYGSIPKTKVKRTGTKGADVAQGTLVITGLSGKDLIACDKKTSDPYISFERDGEEIKGAKTKQIKKTLNPTWKKVNIKIPCASDETLNIVCWDWNRFGSGVFMGEAPIVIAKDVIIKQKGKPLERTFKLEDPNGRAEKKKPIKSGELTVKMEWIKDK